MTRARVLLFALGASVSAAAQDVPVFEAPFAYYGLVCDCDPDDFVLRTIAPLNGHAQPSLFSPVVRTVDARRVIEGNDWSEMLTPVTRPSVGVLRAPLRITGGERMRDPRLGDRATSTTVTQPVTVPAGARAEVYTSYSGYGGDVYESYNGVTYNDPMTSPADVAWEERENVEEDRVSWLHLRPRGNRPAAWVLIRWPGDGVVSEVEMLCATHTGCVPGFTPTYRPNRP